MGRNFYTRIMRVKPVFRYNAGLALKHPFLTRKLNDQIPITLDETKKIFDQQIQLFHILQSVCFMGYLKKKCTDEKKIYQVPVLDEGLLSKAKKNPITASRGKGSARELKERSHASHNPTYCNNPKLSSTILPNNDDPEQGYGLPSRPVPSQPNNNPEKQENSLHAQRKLRLRPQFQPKSPLKQRNLSQVILSLSPIYLSTQNKKNPPPQNISSPTTIF